MRVEAISAERLLRRFVAPATGPTTKRRLIAGRDHVASGVARLRSRVGRRITPEFLIVGVQKGGTTFLYQELTNHPNIHPALTKEIHFFDDHYQRGPEWYSGFFPTVSRGTDVITGEASPGYMFHPHALARIGRDLVNPRLIVLLRDPVRRAFSQYNHERRLGFEEATSFGEALDLEAQRLAGEWERQSSDERHMSFALRHYSYRLRGCYLDQVERAIAAVGSERVLVLCSEDLYANTRATLKSTFQFLGIPSWSPGPPGPNDMASGSESLDPGIERELRDFYRPHNAALETLLGRQFGWGQ